MRLFLHGRSTPVMLHQRLEQARKQPISSILFSGWCISKEEEQEGECCCSSSSANDQLRFMMELVCDYLEHDAPDRLEEVIFVNCHDDTTTTATCYAHETDDEPNILQELLSHILLYSCPERLIVRYDKQQNSIPSFLTQTFMLHSRHQKQELYTNSRIQDLVLRGMTLTVSAVESLRTCLPQLLWLEGFSLTIQGKFSLQELDKKKGTSILGRKNPEQVLGKLIDLIKDLDQYLECLDLEDCHIPDAYLAVLVYSTMTTNTNTCLSQLSLRGNQCQSKTLKSLYQWLIQPTCLLEDLDLSWQRLEGSKRNYNPIADLDDYMAKAIYRNQSLKYLNLSENKLTLRDVMCLSKALAVNETLSVLECKDCRITVDGFKILAQDLSHYRLRKLALTGNQRIRHSDLRLVQQKGESSSQQNQPFFKTLFMKPLFQNVYLYTLDLPDGGVESNTLNWILEWNRAGRQVLAEPNFPPSLWPLLLERADGVGRRSSLRSPEHHAASSIYYLVRSSVCLAALSNEENRRPKDKKQDDQTVGSCSLSTASLSSNLTSSTSISLRSIRSRETPQGEIELELDEDYDADEDQRDDCNHQEKEDHSLSSPTKQENPVWNYGKYDLHNIYFKNLESSSSSLESTTQNKENHTCYCPFPSVVSSTNRKPLLMRLHV